LALDRVEILLHCRKHGCNEERSRATSFDRHFSLRIPWGDCPRKEEHCIYQILLQPVEKVIPQ
jgi:hypothetical protein